MLTGKDLNKIAYKMMNLSLDDLEESGVIEPLARGGSDWSRFNSDPLMFIAKLPDDRRDILAALVSPYKTPIELVASSHSEDGV